MWDQPHHFCVLARLRFGSEGMKKKISVGPRWRQIWTSRQKVIWFNSTLSRYSLRCALMPATERDNSQEGSAQDQEREFSRHTYAAAAHYNFYYSDGEQRWTSIGGDAKFH